MLSAGSDGKRVKVVGADRPAGPGLHSVVALQSGAAHSVAVLEVADPALGAGAVATESTLGSPRAGLLSAGDEHTLGRELLESIGGDVPLETAVERDLAW